MRISWFGNAPFVNSGYGVQAKLFLPRIKALGHDVACISHYGLESAVILWNGIPIYPKGMSQYSMDVISPHSQNWGADITISLLDSWVFQPERESGMAFEKMRWVPWAPVDMEPIPPIVVKKLAQSYQPIVYSKFARKEAARAGLDVRYVPHGVDTKLFAPSGKAKAREILKAPNDTYIVGIVAANNGFPSRKALETNIRAFVQFHKRHPDSLLYLHTVMDERFHGLNLNELLQVLGLVVGQDVIFCDQYQNMIGFPDSHMASIYNSLDVLLAVSTGEGFGVPILEAQACFPAETHVAAYGVMRANVHNYTGEMVQIHTKRGMIEATPNHPFFTDKGWVRAGDLTSALRLLYNGHHEEGRNDIHAGRIGDIVKSLPDYVVTRDSREDGQDIQFAPVAAASPGAEEEHVHLQAAASHRPTADTTSVPGWVDRWGGDHFNPQTAREVEALHPHRQHVEDVDRLAEYDGSSAVNLRGASASSRQADSLHVSHRGLVPSTAVHSTRTVLGYQEGLDAFGHRVLSSSLGAISQRPLDTPTNRDSQSYSDGEYEPILRIERRFVTDLPVYNFTTLSGTYLANGYVVHNCGTPVIVGDWTAMPELCWYGEMVDRADAEPLYMPLASYQFIARAAAVADALERAYKNHNMQHRPAQVAEYDADAVCEKYWRPVLDELAERVGAEKAVAMPHPNGAEKVLA